MISSNQKTAVLLAVHKQCSRISYLYNKLCSLLDSKLYDLFILANDCTDIFPNAYYWDSKVDANNLGYTYFYNNKTIYPGCCVFPVLKFFINHPNYKYYWFIEYDVEYTGNWNELLSKYEDYDFISSHIESYSEDNKSWPYWTLGNNIGISIDKCVKSFNTICRYSNKSLDILDKAYKTNINGHSEVLIASILSNNLCSIKDLCDNYINEFGINNGSNRFRPVWDIKDCTVKDIIYHPIKI